MLFTRRVNRKYEEINEKMVETEFEFLTEQEMEDKGWSECLAKLFVFYLVHGPCRVHSSAIALYPLLRKKIKGAKKSCERRPGYKRRCSSYLVCIYMNVVLPILRLLLVSSTGNPSTATTGCTGLLCE